MKVTAHPPFSTIPQVFFTHVHTGHCALALEYSAGLRDAWVTSRRHNALHMSFLLYVFRALCMALITIIVSWPLGLRFLSCLPLSSSLIPQYSPGQSGLFQMSLAVFSFIFTIKPQSYLGVVMSSFFIHRYVYFPFILEGKDISVWLELGRR